MKTKFSKVLGSSLLITLIFILGCVQKENQPTSENEHVTLSRLEKEIESKLREFEKNLKNGDSIALGNMYLVDAVIMPSLVGTERIVKNFGSMIRDSITGSNFKTTGLWGNDALLVEEGTGVWSHANGQVVGRGKYLVVWKKEDGEWKILRDSWYPEKKK
ncbi:YybH family protein [Aestuariivivens sediminicola]|uniref:YybH family protein n=1 Tax=Aestuariivivens sediminicola TaxID=2913560 RepID=UPI001F55CD70|nr:nuclear transport factor 2 family protein [Aestuariivivens sediminicola]